MNRINKSLAGLASLLLILTAATSAKCEDKPDAFRPLFDGKTLEGWHALGGGTWTVEDGLLVGRSKSSERRHGHLFTDRQYADFTIRLKFKDLAGNSGLYFRTEKIKGSVGIRGFQAEIDAKSDIGGLYETYGRGWVVKPKAADVKKYFKPDDWNEMIVTARGRNVTVHINGIKTAELKNDKGRLKGFIALQLHGGQNMEVYFKDIEIKGDPIKE
ncbi:MAG: DUF1080 domain-containing protein [Planctomycetes bacterium]|nr:DUF1080 domain-containing protein [Planctomycetota bacterium]